MTQTNDVEVGDGNEVSEIRGEITEQAIHQREKSVGERILMMKIWVIITKVEHSLESIDIFFVVNFNLHNIACTHSFG